MNRPAKQRLERADLVALFSESVGQEKSADVVDRAALQLRLVSTDGYSVEDAIRIVTEVGRAGGVLGIVARLVVARFRAQQAYDSASRAPR